MERRGRKEIIITLIIMIIIAAVIISWISGLWSCEAGRVELSDEERLTISNYVNSVSIYVQQSNRVSYRFFNVLEQAKNLSREDLESELLDIIEENKVILANCKELRPPEFFDVAHGYLELVFETRSKAYEDFRPALFSAIEELDDISTYQITNTFLYMYMSDEIYLYFQDKLQESGELLGISDLTIGIDSEVLQDKDLTNTQNVVDLISGIKAEAEISEIRGVAVIEDSIEFDPPQINVQGDYRRIAKGSEITIAIKIENQGNVMENNVDVVMEYSTQDNIYDEVKYVISSIGPFEGRVIALPAITAYPGRKCELKITAGPVQDEKFMGNNTATYKFIMEE